MNVKGLGYIGINTTDLAAWETYATTVLGAQIAEQDDELIRLRLDEGCWRIAVHRSEDNGPAYFGWDVGSREALESIGKAFQAEGIAFTRADEELVRRRKVLDLIRVTDPAGNHLELFHGMQEGFLYCPSREMGRFRTGDLGLGHVMMTAVDFDGTMNFYRRLGFRTSDQIYMEKYAVYAHFLHCNGRQHSLALMPAPRNLLHHLMLEVETMQDVGTAHDAAVDLGLTITLSLGQHTNDRMVSFYSETPSGFSLEYGCGGIVIEDSDLWRVVQYDDVSIWGHHPPGGRRGT